MRYINELRDGENISYIYLCKKKQVLKSKAGKTYYSLILQDKTGTVDAKIWELSSAIEHFEELDYIQIDAQITTFNNALQVNIRRARVAREGEYDVTDYMPVTKKNVDEMYKRLLELIDGVADSHLNALLKSFFVEDKEIAEEFKKHSAAKAIHHAFVGGLLEHSLSVAELCEFIAGRYPLINHDLLVTAALLHDIGKLREISAFPENDYTDEGQLLGHIVVGAMMISERIDKIEGFPKKLADELKHCILAHHGELTYGSPKKPALIEALALSFADNLDAKLESFTETIDNKNEQRGWLGFNKMFDSNIRATGE
ncbi:MAG: CRISPR-associated endonuclease Cas3'' [Lachnospiraceae bacterium]|nr:CRISPR-associated endonuclease Cas3'' [Lachnospiraceae bacterium]